MSPIRIPTVFQNHRTLSILGIALLLVASVSFAVITNRSSGDDASTMVQFTDLPPGAPGSASDVEALYNEADAIVIGEITGSSNGRTVGPEGEPGLQFIETQIQVSEVVSGQDLGHGETVSVETDADVVTKVPVGQTGDQILIFLWLKRDQESAGRYYRPLADDAWFLVDGDRLEPMVDGTLGTRVADLGLSAVRAEALNR